MEEWLTKGLKPHIVEVTARRKIDGVCQGKNPQDDMLRNMAPPVIDIYIIHVRDQKIANMAKLRVRIMDKFFEYKNNDLCQQGFEDYVNRFLKGERSQLKHLYICKSQHAYPMGVELDQWEKLVKY
jgi:hypothetical protein